MKAVNTTTHQRQVGAVILAAGSSQRAGDINKLLVPYGDNAMVAHIAQTVAQSEVSQVIAVTGHEQAQVSKALSLTPAICHHNKAYSQGMAGSVVTGVSKLNAVDGVLICLGDMPHITTELINQLIDAFRNTRDKSIFIPVKQGRRGNPVLFSKLYFDRLLSLQGDMGARKLVQDNPDEVFELAVEDDGVLIDYDTPQDLATLPAL